MKVDKALVFDIWGDYGHFKRIETTTSPLTYSVPTGTALAGLTAAILGLDRDSYSHIFSRENARFSVRIMRPICKTTININLIDTKKGYYLWDIGKNPRTIIPFEFLKNPRFRVYLWLSEHDAYEHLKRLLAAHRCVYTPYLGISELIANFDFVGDFQVKGPRRASDQKILSVIGKDEGEVALKYLEEGDKLAVETIPLYMDERRVVKEYCEILFEANGHPLVMSSGEFWTVNKDDVVFL